MSASLPHSLYRSDQVRDGEHKIAADLGVEMYSLMERAGLAVFETVKDRWPDTESILVCCGNGNNGGDGYVIARLALEANMSVTLWSVADPSSVSGDALKAQQKFVAAGGLIVQGTFPDGKYDLVVDAVFGTGLSRDLSGFYLSAVQAINSLDCPKIAVDLPSGLDADTGNVWGEAVIADCTLSFVGLKQGLFTGKARDYCGDILYDGLGIGEEFAANVPASSTLLMLYEAAKLEPKRKSSTHKGHAGRVMCVGGQKGMGGAIILSGQATLRSGAGLVAVLTDESHVPALLARQPELMARWWHENESNEVLNNIFAWANVIAIGPGLGKSMWARKLFEAAVACECPMVVDADALNLLAESPKYRDNWILTPHPGEAANLLRTSTIEIERDRFSAVKELHKRYGGVVVLKGAGTIVYDGSTLSIIDAGNPGMASGGMGDVLTGVIAGCVAQMSSLSKSANFGAYLHSYAADIAAQDGERGLIASDLLPLLGNNIKTELR
ncbi:bifunctional ADP-dependent NAD(P)H-hydrate dehydratase/NAD(P)H-hydrate epimerase [Grimontia marina]|uniref:Bifunctional NAD(P)H-hydrate repair enzyme n=1 Tax=Grimontia marina TaxID=646534 RepID=A0A128FF11_9GAMM|nr:bifunctional ADP-dependent NAD(P)H-hydrate dehydratase/NAD(P)H-hydrate epimerase [Grimontia marina]CZF85100.1 Bifunctional NAD(P)H-hydrate repair enzyme Nnr [Grimontia marina]